MSQSKITHRLVADQLRLQSTADLFGIRFPLNIEPAVYSFASQLAKQYKGGYWEFYSLSNGGFYMSPYSGKSYSVDCDNGFDGLLSAEAFGITVCLFAYSHLSFCSDQEFAKVCAEHYHLLRDFALENLESSNILSAID